MPTDSKYERLYEMEIAAVAAYDAFLRQLVDRQYPADAPTPSTEGARGRVRSGPQVESTASNYKPAPGGSLLLRLFLFHLLQFLFHHHLLLFLGQLGKQERKL